MAYLSDADLVERSHRVVHGRIVDVRTEAGRDAAIRTVARVSVDEDFTGVDEDWIEIETLGGRHGARELLIPGAPRFVPGQEIVACVEPARTAGRWRLVALGHSMFTVARATHRSDSARLNRLDEGLEIIGRQRPERRPPTLDELRRLVVSLRRTRPVRPRHRPAVDREPARTLLAQPLQQVSAGFTLLGGGVRWNEVDTGFVLRWYRNPAAPAPVDGEDPDVAIARAVGAWSARPGASIVLDYGGSRAIGTQSPYCGPGNLGVGLISFEDPTDELGTGVLALGGGCTTTAGRKTVNGVAFDSFTHAFVVFNRSVEVGPAFRTPVNFARIVQHEVGHGLGLGHTPTGVAGAQSNIMYPSCCFASTPVPPALGPDDLEGLQFIYPASAAISCTFEVEPSLFRFSDDAGTGEITVTASAPTCAWTARTSAALITWVSPGAGQGSGTVRFAVGRNPEGERRGTLQVATRTVEVIQEAGDTDADGLRDRYERAFGLDPTSAEGDDGPLGDPDGDGRTNLQEQEDGTHPRGFHQRLFAEGAASAFFVTEFTLMSATPRDARALVDLRASDAALSCKFDLVVPGTRQVQVPATTCGQPSVPSRPAEVSAWIESDEPLVVERLMTWPSDVAGAGTARPGRAAYGAHGASAATAGSATWYFAEGATHSGFDLFYLVWNLEDRPATVTARYLRASGDPVTRVFGVGARSRRTIWVNVEDPGLASAEIAAVFSSDGARLVVERSMYLGSAAQPFLAGHSAIGATSPATEWWFAEGVTSEVFETFLLLANPTSEDADVSVRFLLEDGEVIERSCRVEAGRRASVWVSREDDRLRHAAFGMRVEVVAGGPIVAERAVWWPGSAPATWRESHVNGGVPAPARRWVATGAEVGGARSAATYLLLVNPGVEDATVRVTARFADGSAESSLVTAPARARTTLDVGLLLPSTTGRLFAVELDVVSGGSGVVVERSTYWDGELGWWVAGVSSGATPVQP